MWSEEKIIRKDGSRWDIEYHGNVVLEGVQFWVNTTLGMLLLQLREQTKVDGYRRDEIFLIKNTCQGHPVVAAFDLDHCESKRKVHVPCGEIISGDRDYVAYAAISGKYYRVSRQDIIKTVLTSGTEIFNFYLIENDRVCMGDGEKYISLVCRDKKQQN